MTPNQHLQKSAGASCTYCFEPFGLCECVGGNVSFYTRDLKRSQNIIDKATRDICDVSVAPASKSKVREIVMNALKEAYLIAAEEVEGGAKEAFARFGSLELTPEAKNDAYTEWKALTNAANRLREVGNE